MKHTPQYSSATPVIFRMLNKECIAIFPTIPGTNDINTCMNYMRVGQHGAGMAASISRNCPLATYKEYISLKKELQSMGYRLRVIKRIAPIHKLIRQAELDKHFNHDRNQDKGE